MYFPHLQGHAPVCLLPLLILSSAAFVALPSPALATVPVQPDAVNAPLVPNPSAILAEVNRVRTDPSAYAAWLETLRSNYNGTVLHLPDEIPIRTSEGVAALEEAIAVLRTLSPRPALQPSVGMSQGAQDLIDDLGPQGVIGMRGSDGSTVGDRINRYGHWGTEVTEMTSYRNRTAVATVLLLILNDGNGERSLRTTLLRPDFQVSGIACGNHAARETICVLNYAARYTESQEAIALAVPTPATAVEVTANSEEVLDEHPTPNSPEASQTEASVVSTEAMSVEDALTLSKTEPLQSQPPVEPGVIAPSSANSPPVTSLPLLLPVIALVDPETEVALQAADYLSPLERELIAETNRLRANPEAYAEELTHLIPYYEGNLLRLPGVPPIVTNEGVAALEEAIAALRQTTPVPPLIPSRELSLAARDHVVDIGPLGQTGHYGSDGSAPQDRILRYATLPPNSATGENISYSPLNTSPLNSDRWHIIQLVIDDGVLDRSHRNALLNAEYQFTGVSCGPHLQYVGGMCDMTYTSREPDSD